jgi:hydroxymethylbilane synthase
MTLEFSPLRIGTRGSPLALWQAEHVASRLRVAVPQRAVHLETIRTTGDKILDVPLAQIGGKALFLKEIEEALLQGRVDLAVHSMKDVPTDLPAGLLITAITEREDALDCLISRSGVGLAALPRGARVGTSSLRRQAQLRHHRPDLVVVSLRGNLDTRIRKLATEGLDAILVATAGVKRLGLSDRIAERIAPEILLPPMGQGALGIECREPDTEGRHPSAAEAVRVLDHPETRTAVLAERAMLRRLEGGCQVPIAAYAEVAGEAVVLRGLVASLDGRSIVRGEARGERRDPEAVGHALADDLLRRGGAEILRAVYGRG